MVRRLVIGAMSGTSADGVDAALAEITGSGLQMTAEVRSHIHRPYSAALRRTLFTARGDGQIDLATLTGLGREITLTYAAAVRETMTTANVRPGDVAAIAAHGQTLFHAPPLTLQWLDPSLLAWETNCRVVSDFRRADCAAGGQGAPLVPFADFLLFRHPTLDRVMLNIGGIANITWLKAGGSLESVLAFDTGPGNCITDWICRTYDPLGPGYDPGGERASRGKPIESTCRPFLDADYLRKPPPKSTDGPQMIRLFQQFAPSQHDFPVEDLLSTACYITAQSILDAIDRHLHARQAQIIVSGGGSENKTIMRWLAQNPDRFEVLRSDECGMASAAKEAIAFALLGAATLDGFPANVPSVTGAQQSVVLGSITDPFAKAVGRPIQ